MRTLIEKATNEEVSSNIYEGFVTSCFFRRDNNQDMTFIAINNRDLKVIMNYSGIIPRGSPVRLYSLPGSLNPIAFEILNNRNEVVYDAVLSAKYDFKH